MLIGMTTLLITLAIVTLLHGSRASLRTFASQMDDRANRWLFAIGLCVIAIGLWR
jgi:hypothetical protein